MTEEEIHIEASYFSATITEVDNVKIQNITFESQVKCQS